jgi:hypothetical protein
LFSDIPLSSLRHATTTTNTKKINQFQKPQTHATNTRVFKSRET